MKLDRLRWMTHDQSMLYKALAVVRLSLGAALETDLSTGQQPPPDSITAGVAPNRADDGCVDPESNNTNPLSEPQWGSGLVCTCLGNWWSGSWGA